MNQPSLVGELAAASGPGCAAAGRGRCRGRALALGWSGRWVLGAVLGLALAGPLRALPEGGGGVCSGACSGEEEVAELSGEEEMPWDDGLVALPAWMRRELAEIEARVRPANHGGGLFPELVWPLEPEPPAGPLVWSAGLGEEPKAGKEAGPLSEEEMVGLYAAKKPMGVLVDAQALLGEGRRKRVESLVQRWLNDQCAFRTTVLVFGSGQPWPAGLDLPGLERQWFGEADEALVVVYFLGQPERTIARFGPGAEAAYAGEALRGAVAAAVEEAGRVAGESEQLERFCYKMAVRLHGLSRTAGGAVAGAGVGAGDWDGAAFSWGSALALGGSSLVLGWRRRPRSGGLEVEGGPQV